jgi:hypothetical protein
MEVRGQLKAPVAFISMKEPSLLIEWEAGWDL